jgi:membrane-associated phospholipid phosphatase
VTGPRSTGWGLIALVATGVVAVTAVLAATGVLPGETALRALVRGLSTYELRSLSRTIRPLGTWWGLVPWLLVLLATSRHARRRWWLWGAALIAAPLFGEALQELVGRLRPQGSALGFPSGHATAIAAFAVATIYLVGRSSLPTLARVAVSLTAVLLMLAIGLSRVILDAHWTLDVVAGFALGAAGAPAAAGRPAPARTRALTLFRARRRARARCSACQVGDRG